MEKKREKRRVDLPHNTEAEKAVLGAMIRSNTIYMDYIYKLSVEDFYEENENHRAIFAAMQRLNKAGIPVDSQTITNELINANDLEVSGAPGYLIELADSILTFENIQTYLEIVLDQALLRRFLQTMETINNEYYTKEISSISEFLTEAEKRLNNITEKRRVSDFQSSKVITDELSKEFENLKATNDDSSVTGTPTGFPRLNMLTHGFHPGELIILAARPGVGKTALSLNLAFNAAKLKDIPVAYFSLEMPASMLFKRLVSADANVSFDSLITGYGINQNVRLKLQQSCDALAGTKIYIDDTSGIQLADLVAKCRKLKKEQPDLGLIVVDYIGLVSTNIKAKNESRQLEVQLISQTLKKLALELDVPVLGVAQLNRNVESRGGEPQLSDLRESGSLEQDADIVLMLHENKLGEATSSKKSIFEKQDEQVQQKQQEIAQRDGGPDTKIVNLLIVKNRSGKTGRVPLLFRKDYCKFDSPTREAEEQIRNLENERVNYFNRD